MKLPEFDRSIPVSLDIEKPNRYGYTKLLDIAEDYTLKVCRYGDNPDSQYYLDACKEHHLYIADIIQNTLFAQLESKNEFYYTYLSQNIQNKYLERYNVNGIFKDNNVCPIAIEDCYLCIENFVFQRNKIGFRYVIDLYFPDNSNEVDEDDEVEKEIAALVDFFKHKGFKRSKQISNYIRCHKLGYRFKNIAGYLEMSDGMNNWMFDGGIAPQYYAEICHRLGLTDEKSQSYPIGFESYKAHEC